MSDVVDNCGEKRRDMYEIYFIDTSKGDDPFWCFELLTLSPPFLQGTWKHILKDVFVQAQIGDQLLQVVVLVLELLQPPQLAHAQPAIELLSAIECCSEIPIRRITSATAVPVSACFNA